MRCHGLVAVCVCAVLAGCARQRGLESAHASAPAAAAPAPAQPAQPAQPQYAQPAQPQYAQPAQPQYAQPAQPQYAQPAQPQYAQSQYAQAQPAPTAVSGSEQYATAPGAQQVAVNGVLLGAYDLDAMAQLLGRPPSPGNFWYDARAGLWGLVGHGTGGVTRAGLHSAPLAREASGGATGVLVNDRELTGTELAAMIQLLGGDPNNPAQYGGRYSLDAQGNLFRANGAFMGNLSNAAASARASGAAGPCALSQLGTQGVLGQAVTVGCD